MSLFNEYGVIDYNSDFHRFQEDLYLKIHAYLIANGLDLSIQEIMLLQRDYSMTVSQAFSGYILRRQIEQKKKTSL